MASAGNDVIPFIERGEQEAVEVDGPDPVVGFFQPDVLIDHRILEVEQPSVKAKGAAGRDLLDDEVCWILASRRAG